jgi:hypothetical protein
MMKMKKMLLMKLKMSELVEYELANGNDEETGQSVRRNRLIHPESEQLSVRAFDARS